MARKSEEAKQRARDRANEWYRKNRERAAESKRRHRSVNPSIYRGHVARYKKTRRQLICEYKLDRGCAICGYRDHPDALHFDHLPGNDKNGNISQIYRNSWQDVLKEIEKCQVLCANCHAIETAARRREALEIKRKDDQQLRLHLA